MSLQQNAEQGIYSKNAIEFATVATEICLFLENANRFEKCDFISRAIKFLPLLYLKTTMTEAVENTMNDELENFVTEHNYEHIRQNIATLLGYSDRYLEIFTPDMQLSETGIAADISENLADIYQDLKDFLLRYQIGEEEIMNAALWQCLDTFRHCWGQKLLGCLRALHSVFYGEDDADEIK